jgi:glycosyltransferase involved in cell wall biosynthesis
MPRISVICPTMRVGGLDVVCSGLAAQSFKDFELILVDGLYHWRKDLLQEELARRSLPFPVKHIEPWENPFPTAAFCRYANSGLIAASGEIVLFIADYTWLPYDSLQIHASFYEAHGASPVGLMCPHFNSTMPKLAHDFEPYGGRYSQKEWTEGEGNDWLCLEKYTNDLKLGKLQKFMWSIFEKEFKDPVGLSLDPKMGAADGKLSFNVEWTNPGWYHTKHESCRLEHVLAINGWDEALDGSWGWQDTDFANRLSTLAGVVWGVKRNLAQIINPRFVFPGGRYLRPLNDNEHIWRANEGRKYQDPVNPHYSLRARRSS